MSPHLRVPRAPTSGETAMLGSRRRFLTISAAAPLTLAARAAHAEPAAERDDDLPPPRYQLAINLELMFPRGMTYEDRLEHVPHCGAKQSGFWSWQNKQLDRLLELQHKYGLTCVSITGNPKTGWTTGLTQTGAEQAFLEDFEAACEVAKRFGAENLITFVGVTQKDIPWETQQ